MTDWKPTVLVVDDKKNTLSLMAKVLRSDAQVFTAESGEDAVAVLRREPVDVVLCDLRMPGMDGLEVLRKTKTLRPQAQFVLMTAYSSVDTAVEALRLGAYDYLTKPFEPEAAKQVVLRAIGRVPSASEDGEVLPGVIAHSEVMRELGEMVKRISVSDATVLLLGETGTGKERVARAIHRLSPRSGRRFVAVNCAAIPGELLESELFGYAKGSFTGAQKDRAGLFEEADGGTLFLDEIGDMQLALQAKLTRTLEEGAVRRLGEPQERSVDVRLVAATHRNVEDMVKLETFREDLWYRLNVATVRIPPLRDRPGDIEMLASHFLGSRASQTGRPIGFTKAALEAMLAFSWPGNVRQLRAAIERATVVGTGDRVDIGDLPPEVTGSGDAGDTSLADLTWSEAQKRGRAEVARRYLEQVLNRFDGQVAEAAQHAGVERESFYRLLRRYGLEARAGRAKSVSSE